MATYIEQMIKTALSNGMTMEQIANNPDAVAKANYFAQLRAIEKAGDKAYNELKNK